MKTSIKRKVVNALIQCYTKQPTFLLSEFSILGNITFLDEVMLTLVRLNINNFKLFFHLILVAPVFASD